MLSKTVLVVERDPSEATRILDFFRNYSFRNKIDVVHSKAEALDFIFSTGAYSKREDHQVPGLILLDLETNHTRDVKILKPLQSYLRTQDIPIIILTRSAEQEKQIAASDLGVIAFIRKPLNFTHFVEVIQQLGMRWRTETNPKSSQSKRESL